MIQPPKQLHCLLFFPRVGRANPQSSLFACNLVYPTVSETYLLRVSPLQRESNVIAEYEAVRVWTAATDNRVVVPSLCSFVRPLGRLSLGLSLSPGNSASHVGQGQSCMDNGPDPQARLETQILSLVVLQFRAISREILLTSSLLASISFHLIFFFWFVVRSQYTKTVRSRP